MKNNIILIGMPGSGKTAIGKRLAKHLEMDFMDMDENIVFETGQSIQDLFDQGEDVFRQAEAQVAQSMAKKEHTVISTGGGLVTQKEAMEELKASGRVVYLYRPLEDIQADVDKASRPLLKNQEEALTTLYDERVRLYEEYADVTVKNDASLEQGLERLVEATSDVLRDRD